MTQVWEPRAWCSEAADYLRDELAPDAELIRAEVEIGAAQLWHIQGCGWLITRPETYADGSRELVLVAIRGRDIGPVMESVKQAAELAGMGSIRFHSKRKGAERFAGQWGFEPLETVYRCELHGQ